MFCENVSLSGRTTECELNLLDDASQCTAIDRERYPAPAMRGQMDSFKSRKLTESIVRRYI